MGHHAAKELVGQLRQAKLAAVGAIQKEIRILRISQRRVHVHSAAGSI